MNPFNFRFRLLQKDDYNNYYFLINQLRKTEFSKESFETIVENMNMNMNSDYVSNPMEIWVIENETNMNTKPMNTKPMDTSLILLGAGTIIYEQKLIHNCGKVAHIEDVIICESKRSSGLGKKLIQFLQEKARQKNCYKVILNCEENISGFYEKCGFVKKNIQMAKYF